MKAIFKCIERSKIIYIESEICEDDGHEGQVEVVQVQVGYEWVVRSVSTLLTISVALMDE